MAITYRLDQGIPLTFVQLDNNFKDLDGRLVSVEGSRVTTSSFNTFTGSVVLTTTFNTFKGSVITTGSASSTQGITGSLTISGSTIISGSFYYSASLGNYTNIVVIDTGSGKFYYTSSISTRSQNIDTGSFIITGSISTSQSITGSLTISGSTTITGSLYYSASAGNYNTVVVIDTGSGKLYYTTSLAGSGNVGPGAQNYLAFFSGSTTTISSSIIYHDQTNIDDIKIGINNSSPQRLLDVNGRTIIRDHTKVGVGSRPTLSNITGSLLEISKYSSGSFIVGGEDLVRYDIGYFSTSSNTSYTGRYTSTAMRAFLEPQSASLTYNVTPSNIDSVHAAAYATYGIGVSGSGISATVFNSGINLAQTNYSIVGKFDFWPELDAGNTLKTYNGWYSVYGGVLDLKGASGTSVERIMYYSAGAFKTLSAGSTINTVISYYSDPIKRTGIEKGYGIYQSGSSDINYFEGRVSIGSGSLSVPSGSLYVSGTIYFPSLVTSSVAISNVLMVSSSGQVFVTASSALGGTSINIKASHSLASDFGGNPYTASILFGTAFPNNDYSVTVTGEDARVWTIQNKSNTGFTINSNSAIAMTGTSSWIAISHN